LGSITIVVVAVYCFGNMAVMPAVAPTIAPNTSTTTHQRATITRKN
jgi:hypothetical protein